MLLLADSPNAWDISGSRRAKVEDFGVPVQQLEAQGEKESEAVVRDIFARFTVGNLKLL